MANMIQNATKGREMASAAKRISAVMNTILDGEGMRKRFDELLGKRAPQFISSIISVVNADPQLQKAMYESPNTVVQAALKAAMYDLPIDPSLGYAYIVAFNNKKKDADGNAFWRTEASFIMGYKGMTQLAVRSGVYSRIPDAVDVREGELKKYDRLTGDMEFEWVEDEDEREKLPIIGYAGYFRLLNGAEKMVYMTKKQIEHHEEKNRKGKYQSKGWREDFDAMAKKTVIRRLIGKYGLMSIDYRMNPDAAEVTLAHAIMEGDLDQPELVVDGETGEVVEGNVSEGAQKAEEQLTLGEPQ